MPPLTLWLSHFALCPSLVEGEVGEGVMGEGVGEGVGEGMGEGVGEGVGTRNPKP